MGRSKSSCKNEAYSNTILSQEARKFLNKQSNLTCKATEKEEQTTPKVSRRKQIMKIRAESKRKKKTEKIDKTKSLFFKKNQN